MGGDLRGVADTSFLPASYKIGLWMKDRAFGWREFLVKAWEMEAA